MIVRNTLTICPGREVYRQATGSTGNSETDPLQTKELGSSHRIYGIWLQVFSKASCLSVSLRTVGGGAPHRRSTSYPPGIRLPPPWVFSLRGRLTWLSAPKSATPFQCHFTRVAAGCPWLTLALGLSLCPSSIVREGPCSVWGCWGCWQPRPAGRLRVNGRACRYLSSTHAETGRVVLLGGRRVTCPTWGLCEPSWASGACSFWVLSHSKSHWSSAVPAPAPSLPPHKEAAMPGTCLRGATSNWHVTESLSSGDTMLQTGNRRRLLWSWPFPAAFPLARGDTKSLQLE